MLLFSAIFAAVIFTSIATSARGNRQKPAVAVRKPMPCQRDAFDAPTLPLHRTTGLAGR